MLLANIYVGVLKDSSDLTSAVKNCHETVTPLTDSTFPAWSAQIGGLLDSTHDKRARALLEGTVLGSIAAYRRYYGEEKSWKKEAGDDARGPILLPVERAKVFRVNEMSKIRHLLVSTLSPEAKQVLGETQNKDVGELWKAIQDRYSVDPRLAKNMVLAQLNAYKPPEEKDMCAVGDELTALFSQYASMTGESLDEDKKTDYLLAAAKIVASDRPEMMHTVQSITRDHSRTPQSFEQSRKELNLKDRSDPRQSVPATVQLHDQAQAPHMFRTFAPPNPNWGQTGYNVNQAQGHQQSYGQSQPPMMPQRPLGPPMQPGNGPQRPCWHCGQVGHFTRECPSKINGRRPDTWSDDQGNLIAPNGMIIRYHYEVRRPAIARNQAPRMPIDNGYHGQGNNQGGAALNGQQQQQQQQQQQANGYQNQQGNNQGGVATNGQQQQARPVLPPQNSTVQHSHYEGPAPEAHDDSVYGNQQ